jgi:SAM-dependent methyltransferase
MRPQTRTGCVRSIPRRNISRTSSSATDGARIKFGYRWSKDAPVKDYRHVSRTIDTLLKPFLPSGDVGQAVEIGPGGGRWTTELLRIARRVHLVDISPTVLEVCRERFRYYDNLSYHLTQGCDLGIDTPSSVDLVFSWGVLVHVHHQLIAGYVSEIARVLAPKGVAFIQHPALGANLRLDRSDFRHADIFPIADAEGLVVRAQLMTSETFAKEYRDGKEAVYLDCVSVLERKKSNAA